MYFEVKYRWGNQRGTMRLHAEDATQAEAYAEELLRDPAPGRKRPQIRQFDVTPIDEGNPTDYLEPGEEVPW